VEECENFSNLCDPMAQMESWHGRQSMKALELFMSSLESVSGRKELILFTQNGVMFPGKLYQGAQVPDHYGESEELAAAANAAQTPVYTANAGSDPGSVLAQEERVLADNLADFTGDGYNRGAFDLAGLTASARRACRCTYRIGLAPPAHPTRDIFTAKVTAGGVVLDTASVPPDTYAYHVRWRPKTAIPDLGTSTTFEIIDSSKAADPN